MTSYADIHDHRSDTGLNLRGVVLSAMQEARDLVAWAKPNIAIFGDERAEAACLAALSGTVPDELSFGIPLLRFANQDTPAVPLIHAVVSNFADAHRTSVCDRCNAHGVVGKAQLFVPMGTSTVVLHVCAHCRYLLDSWFPGLVWNQPEEV
jgi:hypothetical protein